MNREEAHRDQAERLRKRVAEIEDTQTTPISVSGLPSRSEIHTKKRKKNKWKLKYPVLRLLVLFFVLLPFIIFTIYTTQIKGNSERANNERDDYERVDFEQEEGNKSDGKQEEQVNTDAEAEVSEKEGESEDKANNDVTKQKEDGAEIEKPQEPDKPVSSETPSEVNSQELEGSAKENQGNSAVSTVQTRYHKVQANETLYRIAIKYYQSKAGIEIIKEANGLTGDNIMTGQTLVIPAK